MRELRESSATYLAVLDGRRCSRCGEVKAIDEFPIKNKRTGWRRTWCRGCCAAYGREHYQQHRGTYIARARSRRRIEIPRIKRVIDEYLRAHACVDCGETDPLLLDLDHRDRALKREIVSRLARGGSLARVLAEIAKCDVRCGNCHRIRTARQLNWRKGSSEWRSHALVGTQPHVPTRASSTGRPVIDQLSIWSIGASKTCYGCRRDLPLHDFAYADRKTGKRQGYCRECQAEYRRGHYQRNRSTYIAWAERQARDRYSAQVALLHDYLRAHPCVDCGERNITVLEFDHIDGSTKIMELSKMLGRRSWGVILDEIGKCDVRCVNCHRRRTARQQGWPARVRERRGCYRRSVQSRIYAGVAQWVERDFPKVEVAGS